MKRSWLLILWVIGIILPFEGLQYLAPSYWIGIDRVFTGQWKHVLMHTLIFAVLAVLLVQVWKAGINLRSVILILLVVLGVGFIQELAQTAVRGLELQDSIFDLGVDLMGGTVGIGIIYRLQKTTSRQAGEVTAERPVDP